ncbi:MAG: MFS transporter [Gemmatimonadetes bacterium]|nr:MFS transporter [Gemmatimonadota bacterium]
MKRPSTFLILFALWLLVFSSASQTMIIAPILPQIGRELALDPAVLGTLVSAYALMVGLFAVLCGPISDRIGRRRILLLGTGVMALALILHGLVDRYAMFLAVRMIAGAAGGILSGSAVSYIGDWFPYERRGWATGWVMSGAAFGQIAGIPLGVVLAGQWGFRAPFYMFAVTMALTFLLIWFRIPQPPVRRHDAPLTVRGAVRDYWEMLKRPDIALASLAYFMMYMGVSVYLVYFPTWLEATLGATSAGIATLYLFGGIANVLTGPQAGRISDRIGRRGIILLASSGLSVLMLMTTPLLTRLWIVYPFFFLVMVLIAMRISPFSALLTSLVSDHRRGSLMSLTVALGQVGFAVGGALAGPLYGRVGYGSNTVLGAFSVLAMGVIVWLWVPEPKRHDAPVGAAMAAAASAEGQPGEPLIVGREGVA